jgi:hypothetical protein
MKNQLLVGSCRDIDRNAHKAPKSDKEEDEWNPVSLTVQGHAYRGCDEEASAGPQWFHSCRRSNPMARFHPRMRQQQDQECR